MCGKCYTENEEDAAIMDGIWPSLPWTRLLKMLLLHTTTFALSFDANRDMRRRSADLVATALMYGTRGFLPRLRKPHVTLCNDQSYGTRDAYTCATSHYRSMHDLRLSEAHGSQKRHSHTPQNRVKSAAPIVACHHALRYYAHETRTIARPNREQHEMTPADERR